MPPKIVCAFVLQAFGLDYLLSLFANTRLIDIAGVYYFLTVEDKKKESSLWSLVIVVLAFRRTSYSLLIAISFVRALLWEVAGLSCKLSVEEFYEGSFTRNIKGCLWTILREVPLSCVTSVGCILWTVWKNLSGVYTFDCIDLRSFVKTFGILSLFVLLDLPRLHLFRPSTFGEELVVLEDTTSHPCFVFVFSPPLYIALFVFSFSHLFVWFFFRKFVLAPFSPLSLIVDTIEFVSHISFLQCRSPFRFFGKATIDGPYPSRPKLWQTWKWKSWETWTLRE